jgi:large repetitive protein
MKSQYTDAVTGGGVSQDYWYKYDTSNRFVLTMGALAGGVISTGSDGVALTYDAAGNRASATNAAGQTEVYGYTNDNLLTTMAIGGVLRASRTNDAYGRVTQVNEYNAASGLTASTARVFDRDNRVTSDSRWDGSTGKTTATAYDYRAWNGAAYAGVDEGVLVHTRAVTDGVTTDTDTYYDWWDEAKTAEIRINATNPANRNTGSWQAGVSKFEYDVNGHLTRVSDMAANRTLSYQNDAYGQALVREERVGNTLGARQLYYYFTGHRIGEVGNDGKAKSLTDYATQLAEADMAGAQKKGAFRYGRPVSSADFDQNYQPINALGTKRRCDGFRKRRTKSRIATM